MADAAGPESTLCSEQFGSGAARGCRAAADGSLQWEAGDWPWWRISRAFTPRPEERERGGGGSPMAAMPPLSGLKAVLLPQGFPDSVSPDYLPYQLWDSVQVSLAVGDRGGVLLGFRGQSKPLLPPHYRREFETQSHP